ncbi:hypothetical protein VTI28DRAFT_10519 [Corynascus sepedonium]
MQAYAYVYSWPDGLRYPMLPNTPPRTRNYRIHTFPLLIRSRFLIAPARLQKNTIQCNSLCRVFSFPNTSVLQAHIRPLLSVIIHFVYVTGSRKGKRVARVGGQQSTINRQAKALRTPTRLHNSCNAHRFVAKINDDRPSGVTKENSVLAPVYSGGGV